MRISIKNRLAAGFGLCLLLIVAVVGFNFFSLRKLEKLYQETLRRSVHMELTADAQHIGEEMYLVIANAVINREMASSQRLWDACKRESLEKLPKVAVAADTPAERADLREAESAIKDIIRIYEQEMLPLLRRGEKVPGPLSEVDARLDKRIQVIDQALQRLARSMSDKNRKAELEFHLVLTQTHSFGLVVSLLGVMAVTIITTIASRQIVGPLTEITDAALQMQKGDYRVELAHRSDDEIGVLADAFREMSGQVAKRTLELQALNTQLQREIGDRLRAEEEVRRLNAGLEQRVAERTAELMKSNEQLNRVIVAQKETETELRTSREELRNLAAHLQSVREEERTRISREIHDELGQALTALKMDASWLGKKLPKDQPVLIEKTRSMALLTETVIETVQRISAELRPGILDDLGLIEAIEWELKEFQKRSGIVCEYSFAPATMEVDLERSTAIFRILQETLTNIARHARASRASVLLEEKGGTLTLAVRDNGRGITEQEIADPRSLGLIGIRERARLCGGEVRISGSSREGTAVNVAIPLAGKEVADDKDPHRR